jgi:hypothetical protein
MPHSTFQFLFEARVLDWAGRTSERMTGRLSRFVLALGRDGVAHALLFEGATTDLRALRDELDRRGEPHLFYDPLDGGMEYIWLSWRGIPRAVMERLLEAELAHDDFVSEKTGERMDYPPDWGVMF